MMNRVFIVAVCYFLLMAFVADNDAWAKSKEVPESAGKKPLTKSTPAALPVSQTPAGNTETAQKTVPGASSTGPVIPQAFTVKESVPKQVENVAQPTIPAGQPAEPSFQPLKQQAPGGSAATVSPSGSVMTAPQMSTGSQPKTTAPQPGQHLQGVNSGSAPAHTENGPSPLVQAPSALVEQPKKIMVPPQIIRKFGSPSNFVVLPNANSQLPRQSQGKKEPFPTSHQEQAATGESGGNVQNGSLPKTSVVGQENQESGGTTEQSAESQQIARIKSKTDAAIAGAIREMADLPSDTPVSSPSEAIELISAAQSLGGKVTEETMRVLQEQGKEQALTHLVKDTYGIDQDLDVGNAEDILSFITAHQKISGEGIGDGIWKDVQERGAETVLIGLTEKVFGIDPNSGLNLTEMLNGVATGQQLGIGQGDINSFMADWQKVLSGGMSPGGLVDRWGGTAQQGSSSTVQEGQQPGGTATGTGTGFGAGAQRPGSNQQQQPSAGGVDGRPGDFDSSSANSEGQRPDGQAGDQSTRHGENIDAGNAPDTALTPGTNQESTVASDTSTRDIKPDADVMDIDMESASSSSAPAAANRTPDASGPEGSADTGQQGSTIPDAYVEAALNLINNNSGDADYFIVMEGTESTVQVIDAHREAAVLTAGEENDPVVESDPQTFYYKDDSETGTGQPVASGMNGPSDKSNEQDGDKESGKKTESGTLADGQSSNSGSPGTASNGDDSQVTSSGSDTSAQEENTTESSEGESTTAESTETDDQAMPNPNSDRLRVTSAQIRELVKELLRSHGGRVASERPSEDGGSKREIQSGIPGHGVMGQILKQHVDEQNTTTGDETPSGTNDGTVPSGGRITAERPAGETVETSPLSSRYRFDKGNKEDPYRGGENRAPGAGAP